MGNKKDLVIFFIAAIIAIQIGKYLVLNTSVGPDLF